MGNRYGLIGRNGSGKSTFLKALAAREVPIPDHMDIYLLENEVEVRLVSTDRAFVENPESLLRINCFIHRFPRA